MKKMEISIRSIAKFIIYYSIIMCALVAELKLPSSIYYLNDLLMIILLFRLLRINLLSIFKRINFNFFSIWLWILLLVVLVGIIGNFVPIKLVMWGGRNTFRGLIFFIACIVFFKHEDVYSILNVFVKIQTLNVILACYQFFILGFKQDMLGGIFGYGNGNALGIFCSIICCYTLLVYLNKSEKLKETVFCLITSIFIAALAEEKLIFIELALVVILVILLSRKSFKKWLIIPLLIAIFYLGLNIFELYFPGALDTLLSFDLMEDYLTASWEGSYYIPRLGSFSFISEKLFNNNLFNMLFGIGMGNADTSSFEFLQSDFYTQYGYMNYRWIFSQWTIVEMGVLGFLLFIILLLAIIFYLIINRKKNSADELCIIDMSIIISVICLLTMWSNNTLRVDTAYIPFFAMSAGIIIVKSKKEKLRR